MSTPRRDGRDAGLVLVPMGVPAICIRQVDLAAALGIGASKVYELAAAGRLPAPRRIDGAVVYLTSELVAWAEALPLAKDDAA